MLKRNQFGDKLTCDDKGLNGYRPYECVDSSTTTVEDKTCGIKYIVGRWQSTGIVPSQIVKHPLPADTKTYPWQKSDFDLTDIPTKHEYRFKAQKNAIKRDAIKRDAIKRDNKEPEQSVLSDVQQAKQDTDK